MKINRQRLINNRQEVSADLYAYALLVAALGSKREYREVCEAMEMVRENCKREEVIAYV